MIKSMDGVNLLKLSHKFACLIERDMKRHRDSGAVLGAGRDHSYHFSPLKKQRKTSDLLSCQMQWGYSLPFSISVCSSCFTELKLLGYPTWSSTGTRLEISLSEHSKLGRCLSEELSLSSWLLGGRGWRWWTEEVACHR